MARAGWELGGAVVALALVASSAGGVISPLAYDDPYVDEAQVHHGIAHEGSEDEWSTSCFAAVSDYTLNLTIPDAAGEMGEPRLLLTAADLVRDPWRFVNRSAVATPSSPAVLEVTQGCTQPSFTVEALEVSLPVKYKVQCTEYCYDGDYPLD